jgi:hypothetical protein
MRYYLIAALLCFVSAGCQNTDNSKDTKTKTSTTHSHDGGEEHEHKDVASSTAVSGEGATCTCELGENGGHLFTFENKEFKGEYVVSKESDVVRFFLLNSKNEDVSLKVDSFKVTPLAGADSQPFELTADSADADGKSHIYMLDEKELRIAIPLGVRVEVKAGDMSLTGTIEAHEQHDH